MASAFFKSVYTAKVHLYTLLISALLCLLLIVSDKDFGQEGLDGGTIISVCIYLVMAQLAAFFGNVHSMRSNALVGALCYSIIGLVFGLGLSVLLALLIA